MKEMYVYAVQEMTPEANEFVTFAILSSIVRAEKVKAEYEREYPQNEYQIACFTVDDKFFTGGLDD